MYTFKKSYRTFFPGVALLALLLAGSPCYSQSGLVEDPVTKASPSSDDLFARVIAAVRDLTFTTGCVLSVDGGRPLN